MKNIELKYKIKEKLDLMTHSEYKIAIKTLPSALRISPRTFSRYLYTRITEEYSIPADHLARLAKFFNCKVEDMFNYTPKPISSKELKLMDNATLFKKFKLVK